MNITGFLTKSRNAEPFQFNELVAMLDLPATSSESFALMAEARRISEEVSGGFAEVHGQFALDLAPCTCNCAWCSFAQRNGVFTDRWQITPEEAVRTALQFESAGANAVLAMTTRDYPFSLLLELGQEIRAALKPETILIANTSDRTAHQATRMRDAGYAGVYHALRLGEGRDNNIDPELRLASFRNFAEAGLWIGTCVEPIGPEHSSEEIARMIQFTAALRPAFSGAARRIPIPGTEMAHRGMISELRMAQCVAVTRLAMPRETRGNCTHEPCTLGAAGGANLFWAEMGANPRDDHAKTEEHRGMDVAACVKIFEECDWKVLKGPSAHYTRSAAPDVAPLELSTAM